MWLWLADKWMTSVRGGSTLSGARSWSFLTIDGTREYGGNTGYDDNPSSYYRYDSDVANHLRVKRGDVAIVRSRVAVLGIAKIDEIVQSVSEKTRLRCPDCGATNIKQRVTLAPAWGCKNGHLFDKPANETVTVRTFEARYGSSFQKCSAALTLARLQSAVIRPSDQMSIKEIDLAKIEELLIGQPRIQSMLFEFAGQMSVGYTPAEPVDGGHSSIIDERRRVLREISQRRGQAKFRDRLIRRYGAICQISRCSFGGLVEAAHIRPYATTNDNSADNGLLLRSDLHTLFDLGLLSVHPRTLIVTLHPETLSAGYGCFDGVCLTVSGTSRPDQDALAERWEFFQSKLSSGS